MPEGVGYGPQDTASIGKNLNVIGNHAYAYNSSPAIDSATTILQFTTGGIYVVGWFQFNGFIKVDQPAVGVAGSCNVTFDGQTVINLKAETELETSSPHSQNQYILIPPFTNVTVIIEAQVADANMIGTVGFTGKIYGKVE